MLLGVANQVEPPSEDFLEPAQLLRQPSGIPGLQFQKNNTFPCDYAKCVAGFRQGRRGGMIRLQQPVWSVRQRYLLFMI
jgi:hypothetical protein